MYTPGAIARAESGAAVKPRISSGTSNAATDAESFTATRPYFTC